MPGPLTEQYGHLSFGDPCPFGGDAPCTMKVGLLVWTNNGERLPMCELHRLSMEFVTQGADGERTPYEPQIRRPSDSSGPVTTDPAHPREARAGLDSEDLPQSPRSDVQQQQMPVVEVQRPRARMLLVGVVLDAKGTPLVQLLAEPETIGLKAVLRGHTCACMHAVHEGRNCGFVEPLPPGVVANAPIAQCPCTQSVSTPTFELQPVSIIQPSVGDNIEAAVRGLGIKL